MSPRPDRPEPAPGPPRQASELALEAMGVLAISGPDARSFLQGQVTQDLASLSPARPRYSAQLSADGRVSALFWLYERAEGIHALLPRADIAPLVRMWQRVRLRAKVEFTDCSAANAVEARAPSDAPAPHHELEGALSVLRLPGGRTLAIGPDAVPGGTHAREFTLRTLRSGEPMLGADQSGRYVAQMLNLDLLDALSFQKGCYLGQEIVARTQHRGRIKRRLLRYRTASGTPLPPGLELRAGDGRVGEVLYAASASDGEECLAVLALEAKGRSLATPTGSVLEPLPLPYPMP
jgi:tRNA-modifying protein YgfZ